MMESQVCSIMGHIAARTRRLLAPVERTNEQDASDHHSLETIPFHLLGNHMSLRHDVPKVAFAGFNWVHVRCMHHVKPFNQRCRCHELEMDDCRGCQIAICIAGATTIFSLVFEGMRISWPASQRKSCRGASPEKASVAICALELAG